MEHKDFTLGLIKQLMKRALGDCNASEEGKSEACTINTNNILTATPPTKECIIQFQSSN